jgi:hypothetical protein
MRYKEPNPRRRSPMLGLVAFLGLVQVIVLIILAIEVSGMRSEIARIRRHLSEKAPHG